MKLPLLLTGLLGASFAAGCTFSTEVFVIAAPDVVAPTDTAAADVAAPDVAAPDVAAPDVVAEDAATLDAQVEDAPAADAQVEDAPAADAPVDAKTPGDSAQPDVPQTVFCATSRPCPSGYVCDDGVCESQCPTGQTACAGFCRATATDSAHCGACDQACVPGQDCQAGACVTVCVAPAVNCNGVCTDLSSSNTHCGRCGAACAGGTSCVSGACACPSGQTTCGSACTNVSSDVANCGRCGNACAAGQLCANGACVVSCTAGLTNCSGVCRNLQTDPASCGRCGGVCTAPTGGSAACVAGACVLSCPTGRTNCNGVCVDLATSSSNCGRCGTTCDNRLTSCSSGLCCLRFTTNCGGSCVNTSTDNNHCGGCGRACATNATCRSGACELNFRVASLTAASYRVIDHLSVTGDDRGGIAASASYVYYSGDVATGRALSLDLSGLAAAATPPLDGLFSNLRDGRIYTLSTDGTTPFRSTVFSAPFPAFTHILELNATTLAVVTRTALSTSIPRTTAYGWGVFAGYDRVVIYNGARALNITLPTGAVSDLGAVPLTMPYNCENWAFWGVAEFYSNAIWLMYRQVAAAGATSTTLVRTRVPDGLTQTVATFSNLSDLCSFTVVPGRSRWYFHHEYAGQFPGPVNETLGYAGATFAFTR
ncbi:MAG: hypothetical protein R3A48_02005 [Polyangiales bacterium]